MSETPIYDALMQNWKERQQHLNSLIEAKVNPGKIQGMRPAYVVVDEWSDSTAVQEIVKLDTGIEPMPNMHEMILRQFRTEHPYAIVDEMEVSQNVDGSFSVTVKGVEPKVPEAPVGIAKALKDLGEGSPLFVAQDVADDRVADTISSVRPITEGEKEILSKWPNAIDARIDPDGSLAVTIAGDKIGIEVHPLQDKQPKNEGSIQE